MSADLKRKHEIPNLRAAIVKLKSENSRLRKLLKERPTKRELLINHIKRMQADCNTGAEDKCQMLASMYEYSFSTAWKLWHDVKKGRL